VDEVRAEVALQVVVDEPRVLGQRPPLDAGRSGKTFGIFQRKVL
jgi:hypothetical protein